jgi:hypothetical protein
MVKYREGETTYELRKESKSARFKVSAGVAAAAVPVECHGFV